MSNLSGKNHIEKKKALVESSKTALNLSIKSFAQVIIFEIGTHYENADIILTIKMLIIHNAHTIIYLCKYIWNFHITLRLVIYISKLIHVFCWCKFYMILDHDNNYTRTS